jgi:hypothetical protein
MKKSEIIDKLMMHKEWETVWEHFVQIGMEKTSKKELMDVLEQLPPEND